MDRAVDAFVSFLDGHLVDLSHGLGRTISDVVLSGDPAVVSSLYPSLVCKTPEEQSQLHHTLGQRAGTLLSSETYIDRAAGRAWAEGECCS